MKRQLRHLSFLAQRSFLDPLVLASPLLLRTSSFVNDRGLSCNTLKKQKMSEREVWDKHHNTDKKSSGPAKELFTDNDPATTIKGCGFKNRATAELTIRLANQPGCRYKTYWTILAMRERASRHPHQTDGMKEAVIVFDKWMKEREELQKESASQSKTMKIDDKRHSNPTTEEIASEREQRAILAQSYANAHAKRYCSSDTEFNEYTKKDKNDALSCIRDAAIKFKSGTNISGESFRFPATSFVALFGGPGLHGYGSHACCEASTSKLPTFRCLCGYKGKHRISVRAPDEYRITSESKSRQKEIDVISAKEFLQLGKRFPFENFELEWEGSQEEINDDCKARFLHGQAELDIANSSGGENSNKTITSESATTKRKHQPTISDFFKGTPKKRP